MENKFFKNDYALSPDDCKRIVCGVCGRPATTGMNHGAAPFWYLCDSDAELGRAFGRFYLRSGEAMPIGGEFRILTGDDPTGHITKFGW